KMPGDEWQKFANLRMFLAWTSGHPGKKLLFMGGEFGQSNEWNHDTQLDWELLGLPRHDGLHRLVQHLNYTYKNEPALWQLDDTYDGFDWIDFHDAENSVVSFLRKSRDGDIVAFVVSVTPVVRYNYRLGVPESGFYREVINTDGETYGGASPREAARVKKSIMPEHRRALDRIRAATRPSAVRPLAPSSAPEPADIKRPKRNGKQSTPAELCKKAEARAKPFAQLQQTWDN